MWEVPKIWKNGTCWIVGGGTSITTQFKIPKRVVDKVNSKELPVSTFSPYMSQLHDQHVIGINGSFLLGDWIDICFFGDRQWYFDNKRELDSFKGVLVGCAEFLQVQGWQSLGIKHVKKSVLDYGITPVAGEICWNYNSGLAAINLAYHLGCTRIILLGFDMQLNKDGKGHWHSLYNNKTDMPFHRHLQGVPTIVDDAKRLGIEIINANPTSAMEGFVKMNVKDIEL